MERGNENLTTLTRLPPSPNPAPPALAHANVRSCDGDHGCSEVCRGACRLRVRPPCVLDVRDPDPGHPS